MKKAVCTSIHLMMSSGWDPTGSCRLMMAATTMSSGLHRITDVINHLSPLPNRSMLHLEDLTAHSIGLSNSTFNPAGDLAHALGALSNHVKFCLLV